MIEKTVSQYTGYMLKTETGTTPPQFIHRDIYSAKNEAIRLSQLYNTKVFIMEIVGVVQMEDVPVTERKPVIYNFSSDNLPF